MSQLYFDKHQICKNDMTIHSYKGKTLIRLFLLVKTRKTWVSNS